MDEVRPSIISEGGSIQFGLSLIRSKSLRVARTAALCSTTMLLSTSLLLSGCGGGGDATAVTGQAIDAPISNATITITLNAPLGQSGAQTL